MTRHRFIRAATALSLLAGSVTAADVAWAADKTFTCIPADVGDFPGRRVHVRCSPGDGAIAYFALSASDQAEANRVLSLAATAFATNKRLTIWYDPADLSGASIGCNNNDCRMIHGVVMFQ